MTSTAYPASSSQLSFIQTLVSERAENVGVTDVSAFMDTITTERLTKTGASGLIDFLLKQPKVAAPVVPGQPVRNGEPTNRYGGPCVLCGHDVGAGEGTYRRGARGGWETLHLPGGCPLHLADGEAEGAVHEAVVEGKHTWASVTALLQARKPGFFAVPSVTGSNDLTFFALKVNQGRMDRSKKGQKYFAHIVGGHDEDAMRVTPEFVVKCLAAVDAIGEEAAGMAYAEHFVQCFRCGRQLTDEASRARGLGAECATKF
jgi:hypothetical protein